MQYNYTPFYLTFIIIVAILLYNLKLNLGGIMLFKTRFITIVIGMIIIVGCDKDSSDRQQTSKQKSDPISQQEINLIIEKVQSLPNIPVSDSEKAIIETNVGTIEFELYPHVAPNHCANFKLYLNIFHI